MKLEIYNSELAFVEFLQQIEKIPSIESGSLKPVGILQNLEDWYNPVSAYTIQYILEVLFYVE